MRARQEADFAHDGTDGLGVAAVDATSRIQNHAAHVIVFKLFDSFSHIFRLEFFRRDCRQSLGFQRVELRITNLLRGFAISVLHVRADKGL
jgi:hypothetical protein